MTIEEIATQITVAWISKAREMPSRLAVEEIKEVYKAAIEAAKDGWKTNNE